MELLEGDNLRRLYDEYMSCNRSVYGCLVSKVGKMTEKDKESLRDFFEMCDDNRTQFHEQCAPTQILPGQEVFSHIISREYDTNDISHRLYFNLDMSDRIQLLTKMMAMCEESDTPFYLKLYKYNDRKDNLVLYSSDKHLPIYKDMLDRIVEAMPQLRDCADFPLSVERCDWFGYGVEDDSKKNTSFNSRVAEAVEEGFACTLNEFRHCLSIEKPLAEVGDTLYKVSRRRHGQDIYDRTHDMKLYKEYMSCTDEYFRNYFVNNSMRLMMDFLGDKGFGRSQSVMDENESIEGNKRIFEVVKKEVKERMHLTPNDVVQVLKKVCKLNFSSEEERENFFARLRENVINYLSRDGLMGTRVPEVLKDNVSVDTL